jgi:hypothetical protein
MPSRLPPGELRRWPARRRRPPRPLTRPRKPRETASLTASLRKLEQLKARADAELASADKALAAAKTDEAKAQAEGRKQKAAAKAAEAATQLDTAKADAKPKLDAASAAKDAAKAAETKKAATAKAALDAKLALAPVSIYISRATQKLYVRRNTHKPWPDGGEVFDFSIEVPVTIRNPEKRIGTHVFTAMARNDAGLRWTAVTIDDGDDAKGARPHHHPAGCAQPHRADCPSAVLDHHLGRGVERGDQLPHRIRRGAEQPSPGRFRDAKRCEQQHLQGRGLRLIPARLELAARQSGAERQPVLSA